MQRSITKARTKTKWEKNLTFKPLSNIISILKENATKYPDKIAIKDKDTSVTYAELWQQVRGTAAYYHHKNIKAGDRVLVFVPMSVNLYVNMLAIFYIGATAVFLDQWSSKKRLNLACKIAECKAMVGIKKARLLWFTSSAFRKISVYLDPKHEMSRRAKSRCDISLEPHPSKKEATALITFTTGSTGNPKAAKRTHGFLLEQFDALLNTLHPTEKDIDLITLPIFVLMNLGVGSTSVIGNFDPRKPASLDPTHIVDQIKSNACTRIISSPYLLSHVSNYMFHYLKELPSITHIYTGGATVYPEDCQLFMKAFPNSHGAAIYGSTESEPISEITFQELAAFDSAVEKNGICVGKLYDKINARIIPVTENNIKVNSTEELEKMFVGNNVIGEIIVSGHHVLTEYYNSNEAFLKNKIKAGDIIWHRTGDAGFIGDDGKLFLTGRCNSLITYKGKILSPFIYEYLLTRMKEIYCGTVMLVNNKVTLIIEAQGKSDHSFIRQLVKDSGLLYEDVWFIDHIPMDPRHFSKIDYDKLRKILR
ncbi:MAG: AMP-binding protein [Bacteroidota bacterium]|nr:AMP-binding protein [Bacteroidota bacterium]